MPRNIDRRGLRGTKLRYQPCCSEVYGCDSHAGINKVNYPTPQNYFNCGFDDPYDQNQNPNVNFYGGQPCRNSGLDLSDCVLTYVVSNADLHSMANSHQPQQCQQQLFFQCHNKTPAQSQRACKERNKKNDPPSKCTCRSDRRYCPKGEHYEESNAYDFSNVCGIQSPPCGNNRFQRKDSPQKNKKNCKQSFFKSDNKYTKNLSMGKHDTNRNCRPKCTSSITCTMNVERNGTCCKTCYKRPSFTQTNIECPQEPNKRSCTQPDRVSSITCIMNQEPKDCDFQARESPSTSQISLTEPVRCCLQANPVPSMTSITTPECTTKCSLPKLEPMRCCLQNRTRPPMGQPIMNQEPIHFPLPGGIPTQQQQLQQQQLPLSMQPLGPQSSFDNIPNSLPFPRQLPCPFLPQAQHPIIPLECQVHQLPPPLPPTPIQQTLPSSNTPEVYSLPKPEKYNCQCRQNQLQAVAPTVLQPLPQIHMTDSICSDASGSIDSFRSNTIKNNKGFYNSCPRRKCKRNKRQVFETTPCSNDGFGQQQPCKLSYPCNNYDNASLTSVESDTPNMPAGHANYMFIPVNGLINIDKFMGQPLVCEFRPVVSSDYINAVSFPEPQKCCHSHYSSDSNSNVSNCSNNQFNRHGVHHYEPDHICGYGGGCSCERGRSNEPSVSHRDRKKKKKFGFYG